MLPRTRQVLLTAAVACAPVLAHAQLPIGELYSTLARVRGSVSLDGGGTTILSGSSIEAGEQPARLVLNRGGELNICQQTNVSVSASANGRDLMFSFGSGTLESRYKINASSDVIVTPDLRFVITGPGEFDLDIGILPSGDTCVHSYGESTGGVIVNEQMGDSTYQIKPSDFVVFRKGHIADVDANPIATVCGCPHPKSIYVAHKSEAPAKPQPAPIPDSLKIPLAERNMDPNQHVVVDAPFVFDASAGPPPLTSRVMHLHVESTPIIALQPAVQPPPPKAKKAPKVVANADQPVKPQKKRFWHRLARALFE
jgi:hypothetical protein